MDSEFSENEGEKV